MTEETKEYKLVEIPTQMGLAYETPEGKHISMDEAILEILNKVNKIEKSVA
jgi:hypothetical protein